MKKFLIIILFLVAIIVVVSIFIITKRTTNIEIKNVDIDHMDLEKISDSELADLFYNIPETERVANTEIETYRYSYENVSNLQEAIEKANNIGKSDNTESIKTEVVKETDYYYAIYHEYISYRETGDVTFQDTYIFFKKSILDTKNGMININVVNDKDKMKELLNIYSYISVKDNASIAIMKPNIDENANQYEYFYYYFETSFGDWGLKDHIKLYKRTIVIDKTTGKFHSSDEKIREVEGK